MALRKKMVASISQALKDVRPVGWAFTQEITDKYLLVEGTDAPLWQPGTEYLVRLVRRMVSALEPGSCTFPHMDWRFNEFPNEGAHAMYVTCVEIMTIPMDPLIIGGNLCDVILQAHSHI